MALMFLDTSGLFAVADANEHRHTHAAQLFDTSPRSLTHSYVLAEFIALSRARKFPLHEAISFLRRIQETSLIRVIWVDRSLHEDALSLLENRLDKNYSLCDAVSFVLMKKHRIHDALTTDHHFEQEGFLRLLKD